MKNLRPQIDSNHCVELAHLLQGKLNGYKADNPKMGEGPFKDQTQLIIVDRGYDPVAPVVHELTYQAMVMDLVEIDNDVIRYTTVNDHGVTVNKEVILDDNDSMWVEYRKALQAVVLFSF